MKTKKSFLNFIFFSSCKIASFAHLMGQWYNNSDISVCWGILELSGEV